MVDAADRVEPPYPAKTEGEGMAPGLVLLRSLPQEGREGAGGEGQPVIQEGRGGVGKQGVWRGARGRASMPAVARGSAPGVSHRCSCT